MFPLHSNLLKTQRQHRDPTPVQYQAQTAKSQPRKDAKPTTPGHLENTNFQNSECRQR